MYLENSSSQIETSLTRLGQTVLVAPERVGTHIDLVTEVVLANVVTGTSGREEIDVEDLGTIVAGMDGLDRRIDRTEILDTKNAAQNLVGHINVDRGHRLVAPHDVGQQRNIECNHIRML